MIGAVERFAEIRADVVEMARRERDIKLMREEQGVRGMSYTRGGGFASGGAPGGVLALVQAETELEAMSLRLAPRIESALAVLYGHDGDGGLAALRGQADADCVCGYYLMGMTWREVAEQMVRPESDSGAHWCQMRARRALALVDQMGWHAVADA